MASISIARIDHIVLTVKDIAATIAFYTQVLGMQETTFGPGRRALSFGNQKINLHEAGKELELKAKTPTPGSADLCFVADGALAHVISTLNQRGIPIEVGPVARTGALGAMQSVYLRDPDGNLIEISEYASGASGATRLQA